MFKFFRRKEKVQLNGWEKTLLINMFKLLGEEYNNFEKQVSLGIIESVRFDKKIPDYVSFKLNIPLLNKFEQKKERSFVLNSIKVFDKATNQYKTISFDFGFGLILGYYMKEQLNFNPDVEKIKIDSVYKSYYGDDDFKKINSLFSKEELILLNVSDIYEIELGGNIYYHLKDLEDGDFLGIDINKNVYKITHDPYEVNLQDEKLVNLLK